MKKKLCLPLALLLVFALLLSGCSEAVGEIASNVADAAVKELEVQLKKTLEEYKVEVIELKSAVGKLDNSSDSEMQIFCAVLVRSNSDTFPKSGAMALGKIFDEVGCHRWTKSQIDNDHLENKDLSFKHSDFSSGEYYLIWAYTASFTDNISKMLSELDLPDWRDNSAAGQTEAGVG